MKEHKVLLASAARTADSTTFHTLDSNGGQFIIDCTLDAAAASVVFNIDAVDATSGTNNNIIQSAAIAAVGTTVITVFPSATVAANTGANYFIPQTIRLFANHADADAITYSVTFNGFN